MTIRTHTPVPSSHLSEYVTLIWEVQSGGISKEIILPQGVVELVFNLGGEITGTLPGEKKLETPACFIQGLNTNIVSVEYTGQQHLFGIRLMPSMVKALYKIDAAELKNKAVDLTLINPQCMSLWHQLMEAKSFDKRLQVVENQFPLIKKNDCLRTEKMCTMFFSNSIEGFETVDALAKAIHYSPRQANRKAHSLFGICGEELTTYKKYLRSVNLIHAGNYSLTEVAYASGFFDQAHFCKKFKMYAGITAGEYMSCKSESPFHIYS
jgi:AraC-like DNA-binding protein